MCAISANAEVGTNYPQVYDFIRDFSARPMSTAEAVLGCAAKNVLDVDAALILVISSTGACRARPGRWCGGVHGIASCRGERCC